MTPISIKVDPNRLQEIREALLKGGAQEHKTTNEYESFRLQINSGFVIGYTKGKITVTNTEANEALKKAVRLTETKQPDEISIGSDEAGKGEWLGPLVVATVALSTDSIGEIRAIGVMDSKELKVKRIEQLSSQIKEVALGFKVVIIPPKRFNQLFQQMKQEKRGLNDILAWAHSKAIKSVHDKISDVKKPIKIIIDEFDRIKTAERLEELARMADVTIIQKPHAEEELAVACASILARAEREHWIDTKSRELEIDLRAISENDALKMMEREDLFKISYLKPRG